MHQLVRYNWPLQENNVYGGLKMFKKYRLILVAGIIAAAVAVFGASFSGIGAMADDGDSGGRGPASQNSGKGLQFQSLGF
jgi:hypothetical protein